MGERQSPFDLLTALFQDEEAAEIWSERSTVEHWLRVEAELAQAQAEVGLISIQDADLIGKACDVDRIDCEVMWTEARNVGYPILPLVRQIARALPEGANGRVHFGATTQDIMDTALALQLRASCERLDQLIVRWGDALQVLIESHAGTVMAGRTHAQHAVPTTFGAKMAVFLEEVRRELDGVRAVAEDVAVISLFGAGGTSAAMGERSAKVRSALARRLDLADTTIPWHVARGRVAQYGMRLASLAAVCTRFAREVVDLSRTEIAEVRERGGHMRGASSTMPQKANPISSEVVIGLSVYASTVATAVLRAMEAGHERAAGEWQIEWIVLPQITSALATSLAVSAETAESLQIFPDAMIRNVDAEVGLIMSEAVMMRLAEHIGRERAHDLVYDAAARVRAEGSDLEPALNGVVPPELLEKVGPIRPQDYIGEATSICAAAISAWRTTRNQSNPESEVAR